MNRLATPFQNIYKRIVSSIARRCGGPMRTSTRRKFPFWFVVTWCLSHASTTTPGRLTRARELDTDVRFSLFDRNADGRLGGDEVVRTYTHTGGRKPYPHARAHALTHARTRVHLSTRPESCSWSVSARRGPNKFSRQRWRTQRVKTSICRSTSCESGTLPWLLRSMRHPGMAG